MSARYVLILEPLPDRPGSVRVPVEVRLRQVLKLMLRGFGLRCVDVRKSEGEAESR